MRWQTKDVDAYLKTKEYVDTALIPLIPISMADDFKSTVAMGDFITIISMEIERQFQGRVMQIPPFTYLKEESIDERVARLEDWCSHLERAGLTFFVFLTSDGEWKKVEARLHNSLIWLPTIPLEHVDIQYKREIIEQQVKQVMPLLTDKWQQVQ